MSGPRPLNPEAKPLDEEPEALARRLIEEGLASAGPERDHRLTSLAGGLHEVRPELIEGGDARLAFWLNIYNAALMHSLSRDPITGSLVRHRGVFRRAGYVVGGRHHPLDVIEHGLLRANRRPPYSLSRTMAKDDPRLAGAPGGLDVRIHFALNCGARSCPPVRAYSGEEVRGQLEAATGAYLSAEVGLDRAGGVVILPGLMRLYRSDFGPRAERLAFAASRLPGPDGEWLRSHHGALRVRHSRFDWRLAGAQAAE